MILRKPKISVLMPVYNGEKYLSEAIESILNQTYGDFEFVIIDDGSTDKSREIMESYHDGRIKIINNERNLGLTNCLNKGLELAKGEYIARMDCDDVCLPERFDKQIIFMDMNTDVGLSGTWAKMTGARTGLLRYPSKPDIMKCCLLFRTVLNHPAVMMRTELLQKFNLKYNPSYRYSEDYEFWARCSQYFPLANLTEPLISYRQHQTQTSVVHWNEQMKNVNRIRKYYLGCFGIDFSEQEFTLHCKISSHEFESSREFVNTADAWLQKMYNFNSEFGYFSQEAFLQVLGENWFKVCQAAKDLGPWIMEKYRSSPLSKWEEIGWFRKDIQSIIKAVFT